MAWQEKNQMTTRKNFATLFGEAIGQGAKRAIEAAVAPAEREHAERVKRQRSLLHYIQFKHATILRKLADR
jgi:hypothetical protein